MGFLSVFLGTSTQNTRKNQGKNRVDDPRKMLRKLLDKHQAKTKEIIYRNPNFRTFWDPYLEPRSLGNLSAQPSVRTFFSGTFTWNSYLTNLLDPLLGTLTWNPAPLNLQPLLGTFAWNLGTSPCRMTARPECLGPSLAETTKLSAVGEKKENPTPKENLKKHPTQTPENQGKPCGKP